MAELDKNSHMPVPAKRKAPTGIPTLKLRLHIKAQKISEDPAEFGTLVEHSSSVTTDACTKVCASFKECEDDALAAIEAGDQDLFSQRILQSPSPYSCSLGVLFAARLNWCTALRSLLLASQASLSTPIDEFDILYDHPLFDEYFRRDSHGFVPNSTRNTFLEELALLTAAADGSPQVMRILVEFLGPNLDDAYGRPFLSFVYMNEDKASRRKCLRIALSRLELSDGNLVIAAENGDLPTVVYLVNKMKAAGEFHYAVAACKAIEHGHDDTAKWIISQPGLIPWEKYAGSILFSVAKAQNIGMLAYLSQHGLELMSCEFGFVAADALWAFLKDKDQDLYRKLAPQYPDGYILYSF